jgi:hypothetical protein
MIDNSILLGNEWAIAEFSRQNCIAICAFLVPANLIITIQTLIFCFLNYSQNYSERYSQSSSKRSILISASFALLYAIAIISHVVSWYIVGIVMAPTFILLSLGIVCLGINLIAIASQQSIVQQRMKFGIQFRMLLGLLDKIQVTKFKPKFSAK